MQIDVEIDFFQNALDSRALLGDPPAYRQNGHHATITQVGLRL